MKSHFFFLKYCLLKSRFNARPGLGRPSPSSCLQKSHRVRRSRVFLLSNRSLKIYICSALTPRKLSCINRGVEGKYYGKAWLNNASYKQGSKGGGGEPSVKPQDFGVGWKYTPSLFLAVLLFFVNFFIFFFLIFINNIILVIYQRKKSITQTENSLGRIWHKTQHYINCKLRSWCILGKSNTL